MFALTKEKNEGEEDEEKAKRNTKKNFFPPIRTPLREDI
jgi:hypothetical protein